MSSNRSSELELKLELTPQELQRIAANPALDDLTVGKPATTVLRSIYFDTPDHRLRAHGIALRLRAVGEQWMQTVKGDVGVRRGVSNPVEVEAIVPGAEPDISVIDDADLHRAIAKATRHSVLEPQFETVVTRTTRRLRTDKGDMELALDEGVVRAGAAVSPLCEAELELSDGSPSCLLETAAALFGAEPIRLAGESKSERGYRLALGCADPALAPLKAVSPGLNGSETCAEALVAFVAAAGQQIDLNRRAVLETDDPEAAHQLRVGLRRLRSALRAFRPLEDSAATRELARHARELSQSIGELRDADIFLTSIYAPVAADRKDEPGFSELREALVAARDELRGAARVALLGEQWSGLQLHLALWPHTIKANARLQEPVRSFAGPALDRSWKRLAKRAKKLETLSPEQRHEMRKALKALRYAVEFFETLYEPRKVGRFVRVLRRLQDVFGYLNDVATAKAIVGVCEQRCPSSPAAHRAAGYMLGWHDAAARHTWDSVAARWDRLAGRERFWR